MSSFAPDHYAVLGLDRNCSAEQIRDAYRAFAKQFHPDLNGSREAVARTQALNAAYEVLRDPSRRKDYDHELAVAEKTRGRTNIKKSPALNREIHLRLEDFFRGTTLEVRIADPGNSSGAEIYDLVVPPRTQPGTRFRIRRNGGGVVVIRVKAYPHFQFKVRGSDLRCDLKITSKLAVEGGERNVKGILGSMLRVKIPKRIARGDVIKIAGEGLPNAKGGRGDLLVRVLYRPDIRITRK